MTLSAPPCGSTPWTQHYIDIWGYAMVVRSCSGCAPPSTLSSSRNTRACTSRCVATQYSTAAVVVAVVSWPAHTCHEVLQVSANNKCANVPENDTKQNASWLQGDKQTAAPAPMMSCTSSQSSSSVIFCPFSSSACSRSKRIDIMRPEIHCPHLANHSCDQHHWHLSHQDKRHERFLCMKHLPRTSRRTPNKSPWLPAVPPAKASRRRCSQCEQSDIAVCFTTYRRTDP